MVEQSRRDDLESLANVMVYLKKARLPWLRVKITPNMSKRTRYNTVTKKKIETSVAEVVQSLPKELQDFYMYCREGMDFYDHPDYGYLKSLLYSLILKENFSNVMCYSWQLKKYPEL
jgi:hypothetical protein